MNIMETIIGVVMAVVGYTIVDNVISGTSWNNSLSTTIAGYIVPIGLLGVFAAAAFSGYR